MSLILDGSNGVSDIDGSASTPAIRGTDANTGIFFPAADTIAFSEGGTESMRLDSAGNVGIGTNNPLTKLHLQDNSAVYIQLTDSGDGASRIGQNGTALTFGVDAANGTTERMRITSGGNLLVGTTTVYSTAYTINVAPRSGELGGIVFRNANTSSHYPYGFQNSSGSLVGFIESQNAATVYSTTSDYRLKENITPMTGALDKVAQLKPVTYTWKLDGTASQGFIAHELQAVVPEAVTGEKDAVNEDGSIKPQGVDTSFLVATLTAAIQELNTDLANTKLLLTEVSNKVEAQAAEITALKNPPQPVTE